MRKFALGMIASLLLALMAIPAGAVPPTDLGNLAQYYPEDTVFYASIRTDADYIQEVDDVLQNVIAALPEGLVPPITVTDALNGLAPNGNFQEDFAWLGNSAAIGVPTANAIMSNYPADYLLIALEITDAAAAQEFVIASSFDELTATETEAGTLLIPGDDVTYGNYYRITENALIIGSSQYEDERLPSDYLVYSTSLLDNPDFIPALERLPLDDYNAVAYVNTKPFAPFAEIVNEQLAMSDVPLPMDVDLVELLGAVGAQAAGLTILEDRSFVMDIATYVEDPAALEAAGAELGGSAILDMDFTSLLGANNVLMIQDTGLGQNILSSIAEIKALGDFYEEEYSDEGFLQPEEQALTFIDDVVTFFELTWRGASGISFEDAFSWMTDDYIIYVNSVDGEIFPVLPDSGIMVAATDSDAAMAYADSINNFFYEIGFDVEAEGDVYAMTVTGDMAGDDQFDLLFGANDEAFALGTRAGVETALNGGGDSLVDTPAFVNAMDTFLADTQFLAFINPAPLADVIDLAASFDSSVEILKPILPLLQSSNVTASYDENGVGAVRLVITLGLE